MPDFIKDGTGKGYLAKVNSDNQMEARAQSESLQHSQSVKNQQAYQVLSVINLSAATIVPIHIKNISKTKNFVLTYIRHQIIDQAGGTGFPNVDNYFRMAFKRIRTAGTGNLLTPVNLFVGSGNTAEIEAYSEPTLTGTAAEVDRWYTQSEGDMNTLNKQGSVIVSPNNTIEVAYVGDQTSGSVYMRLSFIMKNINGA